HPAAWFMRSDAFDLPATGALKYAAWIANTNDSAYRSYGYGPVKYVLNFRDTSGTLLFRLDSLVIVDTISHISPSLRTVVLDRESPAHGFVELAREASPVQTEGSRMQDMITLKKLSGSEKRA